MPITPPMQTRMMDAVMCGVMPSEPPPWAAISGDSKRTSMSRTATASGDGRRAGPSHAANPHQAPRMIRKP